MIHPSLLALPAALALLTGCSNREEAIADQSTRNSIAADDNMSVEDVPSDGLSAATEAPIDSESNDDTGNGGDSASGGNAM